MRGTWLKAAAVMTWMMVAGLAVWPAVAQTGETQAEAASADSNAPQRIALRGTQGAIRIPFTMPEDGIASVGLYTPEGQLVRIIAQGVELDRGRYDALWDGMDLWGSHVPAGTRLEARVFTHQGVRAYYEFAVGRGDWDKESPAWMTRPTGEGLEMRTGGWLGDHTGPGAAAAVGDRVFFGCRVAEHGHSMMATDLEGHKLWGGSPGGWGGPDELHGVGDEAVIGRMKNSLFRTEAETYRKTSLGGTGRYPIRAMTVHDGKIHLILHNYKVEQSPLRMVGGDIDWPGTVPQTLSGKSVEFQISPKARMAATFRSGQGHFQIGTAPVIKNSEGHMVVPWESEQSIGTIAIQRIKGVEKVIFYTLKKGLKYDQRKHSVFGEEKGTDSLDLDGGLGGGGGLGGADLNPIEMNPYWKKAAETKLDRRVNYVTFETPRKTHGIYLRFILDKNTRKKKGRGPYFSLCRLMTRPFNRVEQRPRVTLPEGATGEVTTKDRVGWEFRTPGVVSEIAPADVILDYGKDVTFDVIAFLNHQTPKYSVYLYTGKGDPAEASEDEWEEVRRHKPRRKRKYGYLAARTNNNDTYFHLYRTRTARAIRLHYIDGSLRGKKSLSWTRNDPRRFVCEDVQLLKMNEKRVPPPSHVVQVRSASENKILSETLVDGLNVTKFAYADDGTCYSVVDGRLCRSTPRQGKWDHTVIGDVRLGRVAKMNVYGERIVIADRGDDPAVYVTDRQGKLLHTIGGKGRFTIGKWDRDKVSRPVGVTMDKNDKIWIAENMYAPKRITRFNLDGTCEKEFIGQPEYGGGGYLDPDLGSFYYRGLEHAIDWKAGTSRLKAMNDRPYSEQTPTFDASTFGYTRGGRVIHHNGRKYAVGDPGGGFWIAIKEEYRWKPAAIVGPANSIVLKRKEWRTHWLKKDLNGKGFIWTDENGDGEYQVSEVTLFDFEEFGCNPAGGAQWGAEIGPDLTIWTTNGRWVPSRFNEHGAPVYELNSFQKFRYFEKFPRYTGMESFGSRAKPAPGSSSVVTQNGRWVIEAQPYLMKPDMTVLGGTPDPRPQEYKPPIVGTKVQQPLGYAGSAVTGGGAVREVAVTNGNNGRWSITSVDDRILLDVIFTGESGGWSSVPEKRGYEVTGHSHPSETFFGHFLRADDGNFYCVVGKGSHAIVRVEGLDKIRVQRVDVTVTPDLLAKNRQLHNVIIEQWKAWKLAMKRKLANRQLYFPKAEKRLKRGQRVDGYLDEWGQITALHAVDEQLTPLDPPAEYFFDVSWDQKGMYIAYQGASFTGSSCTEAKYVFKKGFALDLRVRTSGSKSKDPLPGDQRIVFGPVDGKWQAVRYDYIDEEIPEDQWVEFVSPVVTTRIARVETLPESKAKVVFRHTLGKEMDLTVEKDPGPLGPKVKQRKLRKGEKHWAAEMFVAWSAIGLTGPPGSLKADVGVMVPDSGGLTVDKRKYWSNPLADRPVSDLGLEASIKPASWGVFHFGEKKE